MSITPEVAQQLHDLAEQLKELHGLRETWISHFRWPDGVDPQWTSYAIEATESEGAMIYDRRIAAVETKLKELGFSAIVRVEPGGAERIAERQREESIGKT